MPFRDFELIGNHKVKCKNCGEEMPTGIVTISDHWVSCSGKPFTKNLLEVAENRKRAPEKIPNNMKPEIKVVECNTVAQAESEYFKLRAEGCWRMLSVLKVKWSWKKMRNVATFSMRKVEKAHHIDSISIARGIVLALLLR